MSRDQQHFDVYSRVVQKDVQCSDMLSYLPGTATLGGLFGQFEKSNIKATEEEEEVVSLKVVGFVGGPESVRGKVGDGSLVVTRVGKGKDAKHRIHFVMQSHSAIYAAKNHSQEKSIEVITA